MNVRVPGSWVALGPQGTERRCKESQALGEFDHLQVRMR
jgi:hypothetical protein